MTINFHCCPVYGQRDTIIYPPASNELIKFVEKEGDFVFSVLPEPMKLG